jgi:hypothetical protein
MNCPPALASTMVNENDDTLLKLCVARPLWVVS